MKNTLAVTLLLSVSLATGAFAQFAGPSRYGQVMTVEQVLSSRRGQNVTLDGFVVEHLRENYYKFRDSTGEIRARIGRTAWRSSNVTSKTPVRLTGRVDRDVRELYIVADRLQVLE